MLKNSNYIHKDKFFFFFSNFSVHSNFKVLYKEKKLEKLKRIHDTHFSFLFLVKKAFIGEVKNTKPIIYTFLYVFGILNLFSTKKKKRRNFK